MKFLSILLFSILFSFPALAIDICHLSESMQLTVTGSLTQSMSRKKRIEVRKLLEEQGCSAFKPYINQLKRIRYHEEFVDYPLSKANDLFRKFPAIEEVSIHVKTQKIPENLFHGLPNLKKVFIMGVVERLPTRLFEQNSNLEEFIIKSDEFIGFSSSQFFKYIPGLKDLNVDISALPGDVPFLELPEDFCDAVPSLVYFRRRRHVSKAPRSCQHYAWFTRL